MGNKKGFTIVELTIVIVVIAILAAISIVGYVGVKENAVASKIQAELTQTKDQISLYAAKHGGSYPDNLTDIELTNSDVVYDYASDNTVSPKFYALTAWDTTAGNIQYYVSSGPEWKESASFFDGEMPEKQEESLFQL